MVQMLARTGARLLACCEGNMIIETAIVAPVLALMGLGALDVSALVAHQTELQSAVAEAAAIALAATPDNQTKIDTIKSVLLASGQLQASEVTTSTVFRCGLATAYVSLPSACTTGAEISKFVRIRIVTSYTPFWTAYGIGGPIAQRLTRTIQIS